MQKNPVVVGPLSQFNSMSNETFFVERKESKFLLQNGIDGLDLLDRLSTNNLVSLPDYAIRTTIITDEKGKMIDVVNVWKIKNDKLLLESSTPNIENLTSWINKFTIEEDSELQEIEDSFKISMIGDDLEELTGMFPEMVSLEKGRFVDINVESTRYLMGRHELFNGQESIDFISLEGGSMGKLKKTILKKTKIQEKDNEAFELFRIRNLIPATGKEITNSYNPLDLGLERFVDFSKGCYVGQEVVARLNTYNKVQNIMRTVKLDDDDLSVKGTKLTSFSGKYGIAISKRKFL